MRFEDIDLSRLPPPKIPSPSYEEIRAARLADLSDRLNRNGVEYDVGALETDPLVIVEEASAYREILNISRRDDGVKAVLLATAWGGFLDNLGAFYGVARKVIAISDEGVETLESDNDFRFRIQLSLEAFTTCGSEGAYLYHTLATNGVKHAVVYGVMSRQMVSGVLVPVLVPAGHPANTGATPINVPLGHVLIVVIGNDGNGNAPPALIGAVQQNTSADEKRPIADFVVVTPATIIDYEIEAILKVGKGSDAQIIKDEAEYRIKNHVARQHRVGASILRDAIFGALYVHDDTGASLVDQVELIKPATDIHAGAFSAPFCTNIKITMQVVNV